MKKLIETNFCTDVFEKKNIDQLIELMEKITANIDEPETG